MTQDPANPAKSSASVGRLRPGGRAPWDPAREPQFSAAERQGLDQGQHLELAATLRKAGDSARAAWLCEQLWDFEQASRDYAASGALLHALRCALESMRPDLLEDVIVQVEHSQDPELCGAAAKLLTRKHRDSEAARLMEERDTASRAAALLRAGDDWGAIEMLREAGEGQQALMILLERVSNQDLARVEAAKAELYWELGDADESARSAQQALRTGSSLDPELRRLLARALVALGHPLAAESVVPDTQLAADAAARMPGAYRVTGHLPAHFAGTAYSGIDRRTLREVHVHLLYSEIHEDQLPAAREATRRFAERAQAAARIGDPAISDILRFDVARGLLVLPRPAGPALRSLIRGSGLHARWPRLVGMLRFLASALARAHALGLAHGSLLPSQIAADGAGRPVLGPFGANHVAGLVATRTSTLEELVAFTAPENRGVAQASPAADVYALGVLAAALGCGSIAKAGAWAANPTGPKGEHDCLFGIPDDGAQLFREMVSVAPDARPTMAGVLDRLDLHVADMSRLGLAEPIERRSSDRSGRNDSPAAAELGSRLPGHEVEASASWSDQDLERLTDEGHPRLQSILDREERRFVLAHWTEGCRRLPENDPSFSPERCLELIGGDFLSELSPELRSLIQARIAAPALVRVPSGEWMVALDALLLN